MKPYAPEMLILLLQLAVFYALPPLLTGGGPLGMVLILLLATLALGLAWGLCARMRLRMLYPLAVALLFLPSVFIYYNGSALVHALWHMAAAAPGMLTGMLLRAMSARR